jgi:nicotinamidase-related amidase
MIRIDGIDVPTEVTELIDAGTTALCVVDMQNDFCAPGGTVSRAGGDLSMYQDLIPRIAALLRLCRRAGLLIVHVRMETLRDGKSDSPAWLRMRLRANRNYDASNEGSLAFAREGTWGADFVRELEPQPGDLVVTKLRSSALWNTNLDLMLRSNAIETVLVAGCTTEGCVESTIRDLSSRDYFVAVVSDCVGSDSRDLHEASMLVMAAYRADIFSSQEIEGALKARPYWRPGTSSDAAGAF